MTPNERTEDGSEEIFHCEISGQCDCCEAVFLPFDWQDSVLAEERMQ